MKRFLGLLKREHMLNGAFSYLVLALVLLAIIFIPIGMEQYNAIYVEGEIRLIVVIVCAFAIGMIGVFATLASINRDVKSKELWLHNTHSIYVLVGAKVVYQFFVVLIVGLVNFIGLFFVGDQLKGTASQFAMLGFLYFYLLSLGFLFFVVCLIFYNTILKQLVIWMGKLGYVIGYIGLIIFIAYSDRSPDMSFLEVGYIQFPNIEKYLPTFNNSHIMIDTIFEFYLLQEIVGTVIIVLIYALACKWLERVITR